MTEIDAIVREWLEENIQLVKDIHYGENAGAHEDDEDYQALKRVLDYMTPPGGFDLPVKPDPLVEAMRYITTCDDAKACRHNGQCSRANHCS